MVYQLAYFSAARPGLTEHDVHGILRASTVNNKRVGLSGMLMLLDDTFFQVLEGDRDVVEQTFQRISKDTRHSGVIRVVAQDRPERSFPRWSMGFEKIYQANQAGDAVPFDIGELARNPDIEGLKEKAPELLSFMRSLYASRDMRGAPGLDGTS
jgi:hypothetical protein